MDKANPSGEPCIAISCGLLFVGAAFMAARKRRPLAGGRKARPYEQLHGIALDTRLNEILSTPSEKLAVRASDSGA